ncbi:MmgE/PrpD family protein [Variovorax sp. PBL-E5]|uniref:MmgE/PrpD family protein n=1 Tax=Variovorax sp. PBL-E5 TaxID=434014 RepID=UPI00131934E1|nr:MmgE/PrpD family protein [Variovorax sp. PBL-E5]VTU45438.1 2-methylcitrate dehydratase [Variovorax sp. PBL-E5]
MSTPSLGRELVRLLLRRQREGLPASVLAKARLHIADAVGMALAAHRTPLAAQVLEAMAAGVDGGACRVLGTARRMPPAQAAFANAALMHILDFDDIHDRARLHPTTVTLAASLATASWCDASGQRVVEAVALGDELMCRLGVMVSPSGEGPGSDWFLTQLFGYLGAALAAGIVRGDGEDAIVASLGLAYMQAAGGKQAGFGTGSTARAIYPAFAAMGGVQAGLICAAGIDGPELSLDGAAGLFRIYLGSAPTAAQRALLLDPDAWHFEQVEIKPWPSCRLSHPYVAAALALRERMADAGLALDRASRIEVGVNASAAKLCRPIDDRRRPATLQDAKYSIPWMVAFTLSRGTVDLATLNDRALAAQDIHALADRVEIVENLPDNPGHPPAEIRMRVDDRVLQSPPAHSFGASPEQARRKFDGCLAEAGRAAAAPVLWQRLLALDAEAGVDFVYT